MVEQWISRLPIREITAVAAVLGSYLVALLVVRFSLSALGRRAFVQKTPFLIKALEGLKTPLNILLAIALFRVSQPWLPDQKYISSWTYHGEIALFVTACGLLLFRAIDYGAIQMQRRFITNRTALSLIMPVRRIVKIVAFILLSLFLLQNLGFNVAAVLAGLGIGGIAVALASQKSVENLFGGIMLATDQPVRIGDFCRYSNDKVGTIEDIGLRSVRIRTQERSVITIPNASFAEMAIENFAARDRILLLTTIGVRYETSADQLRALLADIRKLLLSHSKVDKDPARVRFVGFGDSALNIEIYAYVQTSDWDEFLAIREDIFLHMMDIITAVGSGFAFPSQTLYFCRDSGLDTDKAAQAADRIAVQRANNTMPLPDWTEEQQRSFQNTLGWPPSGSILGIKKDKS